MIQFTRLRINGFKSFVDRTELDIGPGLTGIVGPNGCGKSNLTEALRWIMGESSAKKMRGGEMEDVIFNGTSARTKKNIAEVSLLLDNTSRTAPAAYNTNDEIEIVRKIERDHGSNYKINGKNVRARDVQMLFADTVTGANSPALVSQGRITQIINAKPLDRRLILEESAGISGLYARRHEAEIRLKAADTNLTRIEDISGSMEGRLAALKRQARQAERYRNLSTQIRQMELTLAALEWLAIEERVTSARKTFEREESLVAEHLGAVVQLTKTQTTQEQDLPALRMKEAELSAALQAQKLALQRIEDESGRLQKLLAETRDHLAQNETDLTHETQSLSESTAAFTRIEDEHKTLSVEQQAEDGKLEEKHALRAEMEGKVKALEERYNVLMKTAAEAKAQRDSLTQTLQNNTRRRESLQARYDTTRTQREALDSTQPSAPVDFASEIQGLENRILEQQSASEHSETALENLTKDIDSLRSNLNTLEKKQSEFNTEIHMLEKFLHNNMEDVFTPVLAAITPDKGFEKALARALGDTLMASLDEKATCSWQARSAPPKSLPALPKGAKPLLPHVKAPQELALALSQIGVVDTLEDGAALWDALEAGQSLVSLDGHYWRWDGFKVKAEATDRHAQTLEQQNKLKELIQKRPEIEDLAQKAREALAAALDMHNTHKDALKTLAAQKRECESALVKMRREESAYKESQTRVQSEKARLDDLLNITREDLAELEKTIQKDQEALALTDQTTGADKTAELAALKDLLSEARENHVEAVRAYDLYVQQQSTRSARLHALADERISLQNRIIRARERLTQIEDRKAALAQKLAEALALPADFEDEKAALLTRISTLEKERSAALEVLRKVESEVADTNKALKESEAILGRAREARAHAQATLAALSEQRETMGRGIEEKFELSAHDLLQTCAKDMPEGAPDIENFRRKKDSLSRERESIGPVNLRADEEAQALEQEVSALIHERNDLVQAIEELRGGIQKINKEARERLLVAFEHVNAHFQTLFMRLFGGGQAHLALIDSADALGAGLEIFAQPPGKSLQSLSLLSGGEQTMASIALIFAMFMTNPSPICVLDEIDAPLDDANVDRVCTLLEEIAERGETRFLVITHHRLTMARMDRLYGVTMAEKGISQLVSVDLQHSFDFLEEAA